MQIEKFFELQHFDIDETRDMVNSPTHTLISEMDSPSTPRTPRTPAAPHKSPEKRSSLLTMDNLK
jgi:hypothetical protein